MNPCHIVRFDPFDMLIQVGGFCDSDFIIWLVRFGWSVIA